MISEPTLPDPECRAWYRRTVKRRRRADPALRLADDLAFYRGLGQGRDVTLSVGPLTLTPHLRRP